MKSRYDISFLLVIIKQRSGLYYQIIIVLPENNSEISCKERPECPSVIRFQDSFEEGKRLMRVEAYLNPINGNYSEPPTLIVFSFMKINIKINSRARLFELLLFFNWELGETDAICSVIFKTRFLSAYNLKASFGYKNINQLCLKRNLQS